MEINNIWKGIEEFDNLVNKLVENHSVFNPNYLKGFLNHEFISKIGLVELK